jgi:hypothetical protein
MKAEVKNTPDYGSTNNFNASGAYREAVVLQPNSEAACEGLLIKERWRP